MSKKPEDETKEVATKSSTDIVESNSGIDFDASAGAGSETMGIDDILIPRIKIIQKLSGEMKKTGDKYIEEAQEGQIFENLKSTLIDGEAGIRIIPIQYQKQYIEWAPRAANQGIVKNYGSDKRRYDEVGLTDGKCITPDGNEIVPTAEYFVYIINEKTGEYKPYVLSISKSGLKQSRLWNAQITDLEDTHPAKPEIHNWNCPIFWGLYQLKTVPVSNNEGEWFRWDITPLGTIKDMDNKLDIYVSAQRFRESIAKGTIKAEVEQADDISTEEGDDDPM